MRSGEIVVLESFPEPRPTTNPYVVMLLDTMRSTDGLRVHTFGWRTALTARYDVFHVHWPEILVTTGTGLKLLVRQALFLALVLRLTVRGVPVVRTLHNLAPHDALPRRSRLLLRMLERRTVFAININQLPAPDLGIPVHRILHGHYRDWYARYDEPDREPGRLAFFGLIRPYKGVDELIGAFGATESDMRLSIAGAPQTQSIGDELRELALSDSRIELDLRFLSDAELVKHVGRSELVVLPYRKMLNSGGALATLSLSRPVLVPDNAPNRALADEVGHDWVRLYRGALTSTTLEREAAGVRGLTGGPDLSARDWRDAGRAHREAFAAAIAGTLRST